VNVSSQVTRMLIGRSAVGLTLALSIAACAPHHDVAYYNANPTDRAAKIAQCQNDPGGSQLDAECQNAAASELAYEQKRNDAAFQKGQAAYNKENGIGGALPPKK